MIMRELHQAPRDMSTSEGLIKLVITMFFVPIPILPAYRDGFVEYS